MRLTGVGVGPGDPDLVTVKGVRVLREAAVVFVPVAAERSEPGYAERVVLSHCDAAKVRRLVFALGADPALRRRDWDAAGAAVVAVLREGHDAAFATIGDPNLYATFTHLAATVAALAPDVHISTVPGVTALQDLAARSGTVLAEGMQTLALLPLAAGTAKLEQALRDHDTVVLYKGGRRLPEVRALLERCGRLDDAVFGARLGLDGELVGELPAGAAPYLSTVIVRRQQRPAAGDQR